jgi:hypothetical protein
LGQPIRPIFKGHLTSEDGTDMSSKKVSTELPLYTVAYPRRVQISFTLQHKPEITHIKLLVTRVSPFSCYALSIYNIHLHSNAVYVTFYMPFFGTLYLMLIRNKSTEGTQSVEPVT